MAETNDISALLSGLLSSGNETGSGENTDSADKSGTENGSDDIFGGIDPEMLIKIMEIASRLGGKDKNTELLAALKPHLKEENRQKLDKAAMLLKLMSILPLLRGGDKLF